MELELSRLGLIAGNGPLPLLVLQQANKHNLPVTVAAIKEETEPEIAAFSSPTISIHWIGVGQLGKLIRVFKGAGVDKAFMVGQVKHAHIFAPGSRSPFEQLRHLPDVRMIRLLASLRKKNTVSLIGAVIQVLEKEGITMLDSTSLLKDLLAGQGVMTKRAPRREEAEDFEYGRPVALEIARLDLGQTLVVKNQAVVAVETMEGTDDTIRRAAALVKGEPLTVIKVSRPNQDMRFDVPVVGIRTLNILKECHVSALGLDAGKTLMIDKAEFLHGAAEADICVVGF